MDVRNLIDGRLFKNKNPLGINIYAITLALFDPYWTPVC
jgi:hypothetical protein